MTDLLISIHPEYVERIFAGVKRYEFRKTKPARPFGKVYVYATAPAMIIMGVLEGAFMTGTPGWIWNTCKEQAGISELDFLRYFEGRTVAHALQITSARRMCIDPRSIDPRFRAPQSWCYLRGALADGLRKKGGAR